MRFDACNQNLLAAYCLECLYKAIAPATTETKLAYRLNVRQDMSDFGYCRPQSFRVLLS